MSDELPETIEDSLRILEENLEILENLDLDLEGSKEDELEPILGLYQLFDMTEDVSDSSKIKRAESNLIKRQEESL